MAIDLSGILESLRQERSNKYQTGLGAMQRAAGLFGPSYMKGAETSALASMEQSMVGRGLSGTTRPGALSVGIKQGFEDIRRTRLSDALSNIGQYAQGAMPTAGDIAHLATGGFSGLLSRDIATEQANQAVRAQNAANRAAASRIGSLGGFGGTSYGGLSSGRSLLQTSLASQNALARQERARRSSAAIESAQGMVYPARSSSSGGGGGGDLSANLPSGPAAPVNEAGSMLDVDRVALGMPPAPTLPDATSDQAPMTASLLSRYSRWKKAFKRQNPAIADNNIAPYAAWYKANVKNA